MKMRKDLRRMEKLSEVWARMGGRGIGEELERGGVWLVWK